MHQHSHFPSHSHIFLLLFSLFIVRERLKLKQDLLRKQRKDKEREDSLKSETASSASSSCASIIKRRKSEQGLEIQAKTEQLRADILKLQNTSTYQKYDISTGVPIDMKHMPSSAENSQDVKEAVRRQKSSESKVKRFTSRSFDGDSSSGEEDTTKSSHSRRKNNSKDEKAVTSAGSAGMILTTQDRNYKAQGQTQGQGQGLDGHQLSNCRSSSNSIRYDITGLRYRGDYDDNSLERSEDSVYGFDSIDRVDTEADLYGAGAQGMTPTRTMSAGSSVHGSRDSGKSGGSLYGRLKRSIIKTVAGKKDTDSTSTPERDASTSRTLSSAGSHSRLISSSGSYLGSTEDARRDRERENSRPLSERTPDRPVSSSFLSLSAQKLTEQNKYSRKSSASSITQMVNGIQIANSEDSDSS
jgi:hypothetical protein